MPKLKLPELPTVEDQKTEFKLKPHGLEREIVAFANSGGGKIYIGVDDHGQVKGLQINNRMRSQVINAVKNCDPNPDFSLQEQGRVLILDIPEGSNKPYRAPEGFFIRLGATSQKLRRDEILKFSIDQNRIQFDSQLRAPPFSLAESTDFSPTLFAIFRERSRLDSNIDDLNLLRNLRLIAKEGDCEKATNALVLVFSRSATQVFPQARVIFWEMEDETTIIDQRMITGDLLTQLTLTLTLLQERLRTAYRIEQIRREEVPEFNEFILRELLVNALIHRDYFELGAEVQIKLYPKRVETSNPGKPLYGVNTQELMGRSLRRNPLLAEVFHRLGLVERAGTGLLRVQKALMNAGQNPLILKVEGEFFIAVLDRSGYVKDGGLVSGPAPIYIKDRQKMALKQFAKRESWTAAAYATAFQISDRLARKELAELEKAGYVKRIRQGRQIRYRKAKISCLSALSKNPARS